MLVHPEIAAWLNRQNKSRPETEEKKSGPMVTRKANIKNGGAQLPEESALQPESSARSLGREVEYLNERKSSVSYYA